MANPPICEEYLAALVPRKLAAAHARFPGDFAPTASHTVLYVCSSSYSRPHVFFAVLLSNKGTTPTGERPAAAEAEAVRSKGRKREKPRRTDAVPAAVVDLKAELRVESEKASSKASPSPQPRTKQQGFAASEAATAAAAAKYVAPAPLYEPSKDLAGDGSGAGREGTLTAGLGDVTAAARASLEKLDLSAVSGQVQDLTGQVEF